VACDPHPFPFRLFFTVPEAVILSPRCSRYPPSFFLSDRSLLRDHSPYGGRKIAACYGAENSVVTCRRCIRWFMRGRPLSPIARGSCRPPSSRVRVQRMATPGENRQAASRRQGIAGNASPTAAGGEAVHALLVRGREARKAGSVRARQVSTPQVAEGWRRYKQANHTGSAYTAGGMEGLQNEGTERYGSGMPALGNKPGARG